MAIDFQVLGKPQQDNALLVRINTGKSIHRVLFDCGEGCLDEVDFSEMREIDHLFFSHLHMDHIAGFDRYFRATYDRTSKPNSFWGPLGTDAILQHRFQGYLWNLHEEMESSSLVHTISPDAVRCARYELADAFAVLYEEPTQATPALLIDEPAFQILPIFLNHGTSSIGYLVREKDRDNIDVEKLADFGLKPGPWLKQLRTGGDPEAVIQGEKGTIRVADLRSQITTTTAGSSIAYLTDFIVGEADIDNLGKMLQGCRHLVCESQYLSEDRELAVKNNHLIATQSAQIAARAQVEDLILIHISTRYSEARWREALQEAKAVFPKARFATHWH